MRLTCYTLDAFTDRVFSGNPAAVCPLESWLEEATMQNIASENNLAETAFFVPEGDGYNIRWFTPTNEVELCGHATLASAYVIFNYIAPEREHLRFKALAGELRVSRDGGLFSLDFPSRPPERIEPDPAIIEALRGAPVSEMWKARDHLAVFQTEAEVRSLSPDFPRLKAIDMYALTATAPGDNCDFVSRFFAPGHGIDEDPVTGSAHCTLIPYWSERLGKTVMHARQISKRGGELFCEQKGDRVKIAGHVALYAKSTIHLD